MNKLKTSPSNRRKLYRVARTLKETYGDFSHHNKQNPLNELVFILCSVKTARSNYEAAYKVLKQEFPTIKMLQEGPVEAIAAAIKGGGLSNQRAQALKKILDTINSYFGKPTLAPLKQMNDRDCEDFLVSLPRVGEKVARCVMLYSLGRKVFPVDTHTWRICKRLGWIEIARRDKVCSKKDMNLIQSQIPPGLRFSLHVNMVSLGRKICTATKPRCELCPISADCEKQCQRD